jgi:hypothetical protein
LAGVTPVLAARYTEHGSGLGVFRWFVERPIAWLHSFGRLRRRLDRETGFSGSIPSTRLRHDLLELPESVASFLPSALMHLSSFRAHYR